MSQLKKYGNFIAGYTENEESAHIDYIFNLSSINDEILRDRVRLKTLLCNGSVMNPYYYLLSRIYSDGMEYNPMVKPCLRQILINNPQKIALEMMKNGMNDSWLYPEMPVVSSEIEEHKIF